MLNQENNERRFGQLLSSAEWEFTRKGGENPFEYSEMSREDFADKILLIMGDRDLEPAEKTAEIDTLMFQVVKQAARRMAQKRYDEGEDPDEDERAYAFEQKSRGRAGL